MGKMEVSFTNPDGPLGESGPTFRVTDSEDSHHSALRALRAELIDRIGAPPRKEMDDRIVALWDKMVSVLTSNEVHDFEAVMVVGSWTTFRLK
jgi:hypothetical protein